jgi:hypothetical protein
MSVWERAEEGFLISLLRIAEWKGHFEIVHPEGHFQAFLWVSENPFQQKFLGLQNALEQVRRMLLGKHSKVEVAGVGNQRTFSTPPWEWEGDWKCE